MVLPTGPRGSRIVIGAEQQRLSGASGSRPAARAEEEADRWMPIRLFGCPLSLHITGNLSEGHLLDGDPQRLDQTCLALETLMLTALAHDPQIRQAGQKIRDTFPQLTDAQVLARLLPYLKFTPTTVSIYRPIPEMRSIPATAFESYSWQPDDDLEIGTPGPRDLSAQGRQDILLGGYRAFLKDHGGGRAPGHAPAHDLIQVWNTYKDHPGADFPFENRNVRHILQRLFAYLEHDPGARIQANVLPDDRSEIVSPNLASITFSPDVSAGASVSFTSPAT